MLKNPGIREFSFVHSKDLTPASLKCLWNPSMNVFDQYYMYYCGSDGLNFWFCGWKPSVVIRLKTIEWKFRLYHRYNWWDSRLSSDVVWESQGAAGPGRDRADCTAAASHLHQAAADRNTASRKYCRLTCHYQVLEDFAAFGSGTRGLLQDFPS